MHSRVFLLPLLALGAALAPGAAAQNGGNDVPRELVQALLAGSGVSGLSEPSIVVGQLPEEIPAGLLPEGATVVGGLSLGWAGTAVLTLPQSPSRAVSGWRARLEQAGWRARQSQFLRVPAGVSGFALCGPDRAPLFASATARPRGGSTLLVTVGTAAMPSSPCEPFVPPPPASLADLPFPELRAPEGVQPGSSGTSKASEEGHFEARLRTARAPAELAAFYAAQLRQAGWSVTAPRADAGGATAWGELRDAGGRTWRALLAVLPVAAEERAVVVRVVGASSQPPFVQEWNPVARPTGAPVPLELVRTLFTRPGAESARERPEFVVGRLPRKLAGTPLPAGARVVGGVNQGTGAYGVVEVPGDLRQALTGYAAALERSGWRPQHRWIFVAREGPAPPMEYCDPDGRFVNVSGTPLRDGGGYVKLETDGSGKNPHLVVSAGPGDQCSLSAIDWKEIPLPVLGAPEGAELRFGSGMGIGSAPAWGSTVRLQTTLPPAAVVAHYAGLLRQAGWSILPPAEAQDAATATGELRDAQGRTWHALLAALAVAPDERDVLVRVVRPRQQAECPPLTPATPPR